MTREAIAAVMGVELERRDELVAHIEQLFGSRLRDMPQNNLRQADVPVGADAIPNPIGTAPGIRAERSTARSSTRCPASPTRCS